MPTSAEENILSAAQESYFKGCFQAVSEKLTPVLDAEELEWKDELQLKQNVRIGTYALEVLTNSASLDDSSSKLDTSGSLLRSLGSDIDWGIKKSGICEEQSDLSFTDASYLTATTSQIDLIFTALIPESFIILLNIASLRYEHRQYHSCRDILERLLSSLTVHTQDNGACIKICFLLTEVLLRLWGDNAACYTEEKINNLQSQSMETLVTAEKYISMLYSSFSPSEHEDNTASKGTVDLRNIMEHILKYRIQLYYSRINIACQQLIEARKNISIAMSILSEYLETVISSSIILTDNHGIYTISSALASYFGMISIELPIEKSVLKQSLVSMKRMGLHIQSDLAFALKDSTEAIRLLNVIPAECSKNTECSSVYNNSDNDKDKDYQFYSNTAVIHLTEKRYHLACLFGQRAVDSIRYNVAKPLNNQHIQQSSSSNPFSSEQSERPSESVNYSGSLPYRCTAEVLYNCGVSLLLSGNPLGAISYFSQVTVALGRRPLLWIRMAECCIQYYSIEKGKNEGGMGGMLSACGSSSRGRRLHFSSSSSSPHDSSISSISHVSGGTDGCNDSDGGVVSNGNNHSHVNNNSNNNHNSSDSKIYFNDSSDGSSHVEGSNSNNNSENTSSSSSISLSKAIQYLSNALFLIRAVRSKSEMKNDYHPCGNNGNNGNSVNGNGSGNGYYGSAFIGNTNGKDVKATNSGICSGSAEQRMDMLECSTLLQLSYVHLELNSPLSALSAAREILSFPQDDITKQMSFLAVTYACESLCSCGKVEDALLLLEPQYAAHQLSSSRNVISSTLSSKNVPSNNFTDNSCAIGCDSSGVEKNGFVKNGTENGNENGCNENMSFECLISSVNYAAALTLQGSLTKAQITLENVLKSSPTFIPALKLLAYLFLREGKSEDALKILKNSRYCSEK